jgi:hypothetical protein
VQDFLSQLSLPGITFYIVGISLVVLMIKWHADDDPRFDFRLALLDPKTNRISFSRLGTFISLVISTTILCYLTVNDRMNDGIYIGYLGTWAGTFVAAKMIERNNSFNNQPDDYREPRPGSPKAYE